MLELEPCAAGTKAILAVAAAVLAAGCASYPVPARELAAAGAAIERAAAAGGPEAARADLQSARAKMDLARRLTAANANEEARWLAEQAEIDAELAQAKVTTERAVRDAERWQDGGEALRASPPLTGPWSSKASAP